MCEGAFLLRAPNKATMWMIVVDWKRSANFYVVLFPESRIGPLAELHEWTDEDGDLPLHWTYSPTKRDGKNPERRAYFEEAFLSTEVSSSVPTDTETVGEFLGEFFSLAESRRKAGVLDDDRPPMEMAFLRGKRRSAFILPESAIRKSFARLNAWS